MFEFLSSIPSASHCAKVDDCRRKKPIAFPDRKQGRDTLAETAKRFQPPIKSNLD
jgi:hypothetical protein